MAKKFPPAHPNKDPFGAQGKAAANSKKEPAANEQSVTSTEPRRIYHMSALLVIYNKDDAQRQRHMNIIFETETMNVTQAHLAKVQQAAMARISAENGVEIENILDMIFLSTSILGAMTAEEFHESSVENTA